MKSQENASGKPLADVNWLYNHHNAKLKERTAFALQLAQYKPQSIVDLGCASGLWLELLDKYMPDNCTFIGIDSDKAALTIAYEKSRHWKHESSFIQLNIEDDVSKIPSADLTLAFNIFPYIKNLDKFIAALSSRVPKGKLVIRQYDGASIRFGPMDTHERQKIEVSLRVATEGSQRFRHYDMDRTFEALYKSNYTNIDSSFELFERTAPFDTSFIPYYEEMLNWTCDHISEQASEYLKLWLSKDPKHTMPRYFYEVDLVTFVS